MNNGISRRTLLTGAGLAAATITIPAPLRAQDYPARPITVVIMYAAGGGTDVLMRKLSEELEKARGWTVSIANRPGAVGGIATQYVAAQPADGYTVLGAANYNKFVRVLGHVPAEPAPWEQWAFMKAGNAIASWSVPVDSPFQTLDDVIKAARERPGELSISTSGTGGIWHEMALLISSFADIELRYVPYQGGQPATLAGLQKEVDIAGGGVHEHIDLVRDGQFRMLQHTGTEDITLDDGTVLPTVGKMLLDLAPFLPMGPTYNMIVRRDTPPEILKEIQDGFLEAAGSDAFRAFLDANQYQHDLRVGEEADREAASMEVVTVDLFNRYSDQIGSDVLTAEELGLPKPRDFASWWPPEGYKPLDI
ncbi:tripartite tricarboxylate transporter substrate binding protein [Chelativorans sp. M5D2P16]|uniref:Bug family tripartite tricarboxylate transporter substrate binding protein n=1 Tax=Chelativorans sp. M5D2P16 TaxID=3095678 RepID=UPI002ACA8BC5|nr:tripartite tricarboxylate transporter substrate binding protein [Chelativorans sp. M5D2P16]MDZ5696619.1 tripartite tricarboxylate transporter substrate binding protein [Chelativorans sp. M5D2P16]